jgi:hypothetical protein
MANQTVKAPKPDVDPGLAEALRTQQALTTPYITSKSQLQTGITEAEGRAAQAKQQQEETLATAEQEATKKQAEDIRAAQQTYQDKLQAEPIPAFVPTKDSWKDIAGLFSLISVLGAVAGKGNAQLALSNMNGMLEGYQKGRADLYKKEATEFDKNFKAMIKKHEEFRKEMEDAIKLAPVDKEAAMAEARMAAVKAGSAIVQAQLDKGYLTDAYKTVDEMQKGLEKAKDAYEKERQHKETLAAEAARQQAGFRHTEKMKREEKQSFEYVTKDGKTFAINKNNPSDIREVDVDLGGAIKVGSQPKGGAGGTQQQFENITSADIGNAYFRVNEFLSKSKDGKIPEGSKFLRDKGTQSGVIDAYKNWMVNRSLPADLQENDAALLGIAFDVVAARSFGRSAGVTDAKIAQVVKQLPVEGDNESTKQAKMRMLLNQLEEPNRLLPESKKVNGSTYMTSPTSKEIYTQYGGKDTSAKKPMPTGDKLKAYTDSHPEFGGSEEKAKAFLRTQGYE